MRNHAAFRYPLVSALAVLATGCNAGDITFGDNDRSDWDLCPGAPAIVANLKIAPVSLSLQVQQAVPVTAVSTDAAGKWDFCFPEPTWTTSDSAVVRVELPVFTSAWARAIGNGSAYIKVMQGNKADSILVTVSNASAAVATAEARLTSAAGQSDPLKQRIEARIGAQGIQPRLDLEVTH